MEEKQMGLGLGGARQKGWNFVLWWTPLFDRNLFQNIGFPRHHKNWYKCQRWDLSQRNLNFSLYLYLDLYFSLSLSEFFAKTDSGMLASLVNIVNDAMSVKDKLCWHLSTTCWWHWITQGWSFGYLLIYVGSQQMQNLCLYLTVDYIELLMAERFHIFKLNKGNNKCNFRFPMMKVTWSFIIVVQFIVKH